MSDPVVDALIIDLLQFLASGERTYEEVMDAWRTSCPKLPVWEDANDRGLIAAENVNGRELVRTSALGLALLDRRRAYLEADRTAVHLRDLNLLRCFRCVAIFPQTLTGNPIAANFSCARLAGREQLCYCLGTLRLR